VIFRSGNEITKIGGEKAIYSLAQNVLPGGPLVEKQRYTIIAGEQTLKNI
jgi:hypothetical protein